MDERPAKRPVGNDQSRGGYGDNQDRLGGQPDPKEESPTPPPEREPTAAGGWIVDRDVDLGEETP
jgi:hypothetical protein